MILSLIGIGVVVPVYVPVIVTVMQAIGMLGNPFVTIIYCFEQIEIFMGGSARASDLRTALSFFTLWGLVIAGFYIQKFPVTICFGYLFSNNIYLGLGLIKQFGVVNEKMD
jgi:hypothetical protein